jgi:hypothetical protein
VAMRAQKEGHGILGTSPEVVRKHYAKWSLARQEQIDVLMELVHSEANCGQREKLVRVP